MGPGHRRRTRRRLHRHRRSPDAWFTYYFWENDALAPDYARTIDIHRKPGYDPCELFLDPALRFPKLDIAKFLLKKKLGLRGLLEVIPLDASLVKGSHGRDRVPDNERPVLLGTRLSRSTAAKTFTMRSSMPCCGLEAL